MKLSIKWLKDQNACSRGVAAFAAQKETNALKVLKALIAADKLDWANWLIVRVMSRKQWLKYAIFAAECVLGIYEKRYPKDDRPRKAIEAAKKVLKNDTKQNRSAAYAAEDATYAAADAAAYAANAAANAANAAAYGGASAAYAAADAAVYAAYAANAAAYAAAYAANAAADATYAEMKTKILNYGIKLLEAK